MADRYAAWYTVPPPAVRTAGWVGWRATWAAEGASVGSARELADLRDQLRAALEARGRSDARARDVLGLAHELSSGDGDEVIAEKVAAALPRIVGGQRSSVLRWDAASGELRALATAGLSEAEHGALLGSVLRPHETPELVEMLARREPTFLDPTTATPVLRALMAAVGAERVVAVPLSAGRRCSASRRSGGRPRPDPWTRWSTTRSSLGCRASPTRLLPRSTSPTCGRPCGTGRIHDALTGLPNRSTFTRRVETTLRGCDPGASVTVLEFDLDRFRGVNDTIGHAAGDELLRQVAARVRKVVGPADLLARLSGDEFAIVAAVPDAAAASGLAGRVVSCFEEPFHLEGRDHRTTTSVGVAVHHGSDGEGDRLLRSADQAMHLAKQRGRNQVVAADDAPGVAVAGSLGEELASRHRRGPAAAALPAHRASRGG